MQATNDPLANAIPDVCRRLKIGRSKVYELIGAGEIKTIKIGSRTLIPECELVRFVAERLETGAP